MLGAGFGHFLLTRMNVDVRFAPSGRGLDPQWLHHRLKLFETICLPSVVAQTSCDFHWLLFIAGNSPAWFVGSLRRLLDQSKKNRGVKFDHSLVPCLRFGPTEVRDAVCARLPPDCSHILSTRLDNDDALASDALLRVQSAFDASFTGYLNFPNGFVLHGRRVYRAVDEANAFCTFCAPVEQAFGPFSVPHNEMATRFPVRQIDDRAGWLVCVHDRNAAHRPFGTRVSKNSLRVGFSQIVDEVLQSDRENPFDVFFERLWSATYKSLSKVFKKLRQFAHS